MGRTEVSVVSWYTVACSSVPWWVSAPYPTRETGLEWKQEVPRECVDVENGPHPPSQDFHRGDVWVLRCSNRGL